MGKLLRAIRTLLHLILPGILYGYWVSSKELRRAEKEIELIRGGL
jgi:hypothetical protein